MAIADKDVAKEGQKLLKKSETGYQAGCTVAPVPRSSMIKTVRLLRLSTLMPSGDQELVVDKLIVAVGRRPYTD